MKLLKAASIIDEEIEGYYVYFPLVEQIATQAHYHDFYEVFLVIAGQINHHVNGEKILLKSGALVLIRPDDVHFYSNAENQNCELINLAFLTGTLDQLLAYLGLVNGAQVLLAAPLPLTVTLSPVRRNLLAAQIKEWGLFMYRRDKAVARLALRALLAQIITQFFHVSPFEEDVGNPPVWLAEVYQQMQQRHHVVEGRPALMRLANRSPEHVGRAFKTYLGVTPSQFINDLRLDYAADLLRHTDRSVLDICFDVGFGNLSHFYHRFKERWDCSPMQFRNQNRQTLIP